MWVFMGVTGHNLHLGSSCVLVPGELAGGYCTMLNGMTTQLPGSVAFPLLMFHLDSASHGAVLTSRGGAR